MPWNEQIVPDRSIVSVDGILWSRRGGVTGPLFPSATLSLVWDSSSFYDLTLDHQSSFGQPLSMALEGLGTNGWYDLWRGPMGELPTRINLTGLQFTEVRVRYTANNGCEYHAPASISCDPLAQMTVIAAVATVDRATIEAAGPEEGDTYIVVSGNQNVWNIGTIVTWNGTGWDTAWPHGGTVFLADESGAYWLFDNVGGFALLAPPLTVTYDEEGNGFTLVSLYPFVNSNGVRQATIIGTMDGDEVNVYNGPESYLSAPRHFDLGAPVTNMQVVYEAGRCAWTASVEEGAGTIFPGPPQGYLNNAVQQLDFDSEGRIMLAGRFSAWTDPYTDASRGGRLLPDLNLDMAYANAFQSGFSGGSSSSAPAALAVVVDNEGRSVFGGLFSTYKGQPAKSIVRILSDGTRDTSFNIGTGFSGPVFNNGLVGHLLLLPDGTLICSGFFREYNGVSGLGSILALNPDGSINTSWNFGSGVGNTVEGITLCANGDIIIAGPWPSYNGIPLPGTGVNRRVVRIRPDGSLNPDFDINTLFNEGVSAIVELPDGRLAFGGGFTWCRGEAVRGVCITHADGTIDHVTQDVINADADIRACYSLVYNAHDEYLYLGGNPFSVGGPPAENKIQRMRLDGVRDSGFKVSSGAQNFITAMHIDEISNTLVAAGDFSVINGQPRYYIVRISI